ncbi:FecR domain-containing protein [Hyalangium rubrum]|uniref:FecR domain-containing protein n=1 Tax=Hyalangium rubrum TaxID=3103134 RepID=A0ABU5H5Y4_9BACT|nr:FecR domain-containing protein [Hyalangium sp. s54d21]MDY7228716.1 FecR domain-containing protein [Hyalangium sp. s54d21]
MARHETEALWAFAAGELEVEANARVAEHVAGCEVCAQKLTELRRAQSLLSTAREESPEVRWAEVNERLQSAAAQRLARLEQRPRWPWALAATGALAAVLAFVVLRPAAPPPQPSPPKVAVVREETPPPQVARQEPPAPAPVPPSPVPPEAPAPTAAPLIATRVESATGAWIREPKTPERLLQPGTQLQAGTSVRTRAKSNAQLQLPDASRVRLSPNSEVTLARTVAEDVHLTVKRGRLTVRASHVARKGFTVEAAGVRASVVGTVFSVERTARGAVVAVLEGRVQIETAGQLPRLVNAGERVAVTSGKPTPKARALSAKDRQVFQELGLPLAEPMPTPAPRPAPAEPSPARAPEPAAAVSPASPEPEPSASAPPEEKPAPVAMAPSAPESSGSEFAPYPVPSSPEPTETVVAPSAPDTRWTPPEPGVAQPGTTDARFLWHAREQLNATACESFLVGLAEIAVQSPVREFREQARYLRARCFEERLAKDEAATEYRRYLREFPKGRYVREAKAALLP